jgi:hypothetical protein
VAEQEGLMGKFRIVAARPKNATNHLNSEFKVYEDQVGDGKRTWRNIGWKTIHDVSALLKTGNEIRTGKVEDGKMLDGVAVELELRISKNDSKYKISEMPDD